jgi:hypothetical protein
MQTNSAVVNGDFSYSAGDLLGLADAGGLGKNLKTPYLGTLSSFP